MKKYVKKKLPFFQVHRVLSTMPKKCAIVMRQIKEPYVIDGVPEGYFCVSDGYLLLPKRRRGEKFLVAYTVMHEDVL